MADNLQSSKTSLANEIQEALRVLSAVEKELKNVKSEAIELQSFSKGIDEDFKRIEVTYFQNPKSR